MTSLKNNKNSKFLSKKKKIVTDFNVPEGGGIFSSRTTLKAEKKTPELDRKTVSNLINFRLIGGAFVEPQGVVL